MNIGKVFVLPALVVMSSIYFCWKSPRQMSPVFLSSMSTIRRKLESKVLGLKAHTIAIYSFYIWRLKVAFPYLIEGDFLFKLDVLHQYDFYLNFT